MTKMFFLLASSTLAMIATTPAIGQSMQHDGMTMPMPAAHKPAAHKPAAHKPAVKKPVPKKPAVARATPRKPAAAKPVTVTEPAPVAEPLVALPSPSTSTADHSAMGHAAPATNPAVMAGMDHVMTGALGRYPSTREASGTAWQPDASAHQGIMTKAGDWMLMGHGTLNLVADTQSGPRGDDKLFASGMLMGMAQRPVGNGTLQLRAALSPDPLMGKRGYPLLLAAGETADGVNRLVDRQHPHELIMELSASVSQSIGQGNSIFIYGGLPGEPAFGPPAFMHREAIMDSPEAPITHHWLDSTHISFGVVTAGVVIGNAKFEVSRFNGREPDQNRFDIETGKLDSTAVRASWNPTRTLSLQGSFGRFIDSEQLEPGVDQTRWSASALYAREISPGLKFATGFAWGRKTAEGHSDDAFALEASLKKGGWTAFARGEVTEQRELVETDTEEHGLAYRVAKASLGVVRDFRIAKTVSLGLGGLVSINAVPDALAPLYGGNNPLGAMGFVRLRLM